VLGSKTGIGEPNMATRVGKTIQIYLPDGNPRSVKIAEITSRTVQTLLIPRASLEFAYDRSELSQVGVYFLLGETAEGEKPLVYVGEAEDCVLRLKQQNKAKDFWTNAIVIVSKTRYFTKTHVKFLEWFCHEEVKKASRYRLENPTTPPRPFVSESVESDLHDNFDTLKVLVATLGYPLFDEIKAPDTSELLYCRGKSVEARGEYTEDGFVVLGGSTAQLKEAPSASGWVQGIRNNLVDNGVFEISDGVYRFTASFVFSAPSAAAAAVLGKNANGWLEWKYKDGRTLDEVKRQSITVGA
jgi:hypothetical protein